MKKIDWPVVSKWYEELKAPSLNTIVSRIAEVRGDLDPDAVREDLKKEADELQGSSRLEYVGVLLLASALATSAGNFPVELENLRDKAGEHLRRWGILKDK